MTDRTRDILKSLTLVCSVLLIGYWVVAGLWYHTFLPPISQTGAVLYAFVFGLDLPGFIVIIQEQAERWTNGAFEPLPKEGV